MDYSNMTLEQLEKKQQGLGDKQGDIRTEKAAIQDAIDARVAESEAQAIIERSSEKVLQELRRQLSLMPSDIENTDIP